jgi:predicted nuclease with TOPRIM domain
MTSDEILKLFAAAGVLLTIFVSLFTASQSASKNGFEQLERVVKLLEKRVGELETDNRNKDTELEDLRERVDSLEKENERKDGIIKMLQDENLFLKTRPRSNGFGLK